MTGYLYVPPPTPVDLPHSCFNTAGRDDLEARGLEGKLAPADIGSLWRCQCGTWWVADDTVNGPRWALLANSGDVDARNRAHEAELEAAALDATD